MKSLKVVFLGTPEFAKTSLEAIHQSRHEVVGVVTVADKASGRGQKVNQSPVKIFAAEHHIPVFQPEKLRNPEFLEELRKLNADVFVVVAFRMMPKVLFEMPRMGTFNLHASLLPDYRGAAPINYAVINGEEKTGATTFFINEKIDEGNILLQEELDILPYENAGNLHDRLMEMGAGLVVKTLDGLADETIQERPQPQVEHPKNAYKIFKEDTKIQWDAPSGTVHQFILGMSPYPAAFTTLKIGDEEKGLKIFSGKYEHADHGEKAGTLDISKNGLGIYTQDGIYYPQELQLEGKKRMGVKDFLNGFRNFEHITMA
ncbi:methionyl-tRNA formyltransferase [uncultured Chryseobacterium sp.]|uniref:methionyl-tRNA formyltransferase n=1 Tax=uncultured Chryseobacterium sp. TaxID=259322 RepID=UPI0025DD59B5|nr:methionyl-tRNA formyltransferase [uncultured Chryseobacterium sp.]